MDVLFSMKLLVCILRRRLLRAVYSELLGDGENKRQTGLVCFCLSSRRTNGRLSACLNKMAEQRFTEQLAVSSARSLLSWRLVS